MLLLVRYVLKLNMNTVDYQAYCSPFLSQLWNTISLDFIKGLPKYKTFDTILVVINKLTKYAHFLS